MALDLPSAEDTCYKNHPYNRNTFTTTTTTTSTGENGPNVSGDLEKTYSRHGEQGPHLLKTELDHDAHAVDHSVSQLDLSTHSTSSTSDNDREDGHHMPSTLPERVTSRLSTSSTLTFPEGGLAAWLAVVGSFSAMLSIFGLINSSAVFESYFSEHQLKDYNSSQIGWIFSLYLFMVFFVGIHVGPVFDQHGPKWLVPTGSLFMVLSLMLLGFCTGKFISYCKSTNCAPADEKTTEYYQILLTYSVLGGLGGALLNSPAYGTIAHHFNRRRGFATGIASTAGGIGGIVFPIMMQKLLPRLGFAWSTRILGFMLLALAVPANLWIKARLPPRRETKVEDAETRRSWSARLAGLLPNFGVFRDKRFALAAAGIFFMEWGLFIPLTFIVSYAAANGQNATSSYTLLSFLNIGSVVGRFLPGAMADRFGRFNVIILTISLCCATVLGLWLPADSSETLIIVFVVIFGFASGSNLGLVPVCLGQLCDSRDYARYMTTANFLASFGTLSSTPLGGALLGLGGEKGWMAIILFSGLSYAVALSCYVSARVLAVGWGLRTVF